ncbi:apomucin-like isoform X2 [Hemicordylus capensis]|uniref:apomucin-like isoform X2 n=1 Tax=Hemicordylus capensis TaxID=884348 RepID=UPI00230296E4|nr:apomucin-like isoform X2 [Hemicordylus capensis]
MHSKSLVQGNVLFYLHSVLRMNTWADFPSLSQFMSLIGETFNDPDNPCLHYTCTVGGFTTEIEECPGQNWCSNESRLYHVDKCCYDCVNRCQPTPVRIQVSANGCKGYITMAKCIGDCKKETMFDDIDRKVVNECLCCQPKEHEIKSIPIFCPGGRSEVYTYKHTVSCSCQACGP